MARPKPLARRAGASRGKPFNKGGKVGKKAS